MPASSTRLSATRRNRGHADFRVGYLATTKANRHPDFRTLAKKALT